MDGIEPDQYGVIGIVVLLVGKMAVEYWQRMGQDSPADMREKVLGELDRIRIKVENCNDVLHGVSQKTDTLHDWHNQTDANGNKIWYRGPTDATLDRIESTLKTIERNVVDE